MTNDKKKGGVRKGCSGAIDFSSKRAGLMVPLFALRGKEDWGIGDTQALCEAIDFCRKQGFTVLQILPINETGGDHSPYNAISAFAIEPTTIALDPGRVPGLTRKMREDFFPSSERVKYGKGPVDYAWIKPKKQAILRAAFAAFDSGKTKKNREEKKDWEQFLCEESHWLDEYLLFRYLFAHYGQSGQWELWDPAHQSYGKAQCWLEGLPQAQAKVCREGMRFYGYVQWVAYRQWQGVKEYADKQGVELMGDIPFGVSRTSADVWARRDLFDLEWSGGAPPEPFFDTDAFVKKWGQNWGIPLYEWKAHKAEKFAWWKHRIHSLHECFHYFRIDHVLGFFRLYSFPWQPQENDCYLEMSQKEARKKTGGRLPQFLPAGDEYEADAQKNERQGVQILKMILKAAQPTGVVAEDLGMVPFYVRPALQKLKIPGFSIPLFEREESTQEFRPRDFFSPLNIATYATHDHSPLCVYYQQLCEEWHGPHGHQAWLEVQRLMRFLNREDQSPPTRWTAELHDAFSQALLETRCWLAMWMITDVLGTQDRFNQPGSSARTNWSHRLECPLDEYAQSEVYGPRIKALRKGIVKAGRNPFKG